MASAKGFSGEGIINIEAEDMKATGGQWGLVQTGHYSGSKAIYTAKSDSELLAPIKDIPKGEYTAIVYVWSYNNGSNTVVLKSAGKSSTITWDAKLSEQVLPISTTVTIDESSAEPYIRLTPVQIGQPYVLVDRITLVPPSVVANDWRQLPLIVFAAAGLLLSAISWGALLLRRLLPGWREEGFLRLVLGMALGLGFLGTLTSMLGILGWFVRPVVYSLLIAGIVLGGRSAFTLVHQCINAFLLHSFRVKAVVLLISAVIGIATLPALAPAVGIDPQIYHLAIAKWLLAEGGFHYHPYHIPWAYPHLVSNLFALGQAIFNDPFFRVAQLVSAILGAGWLASVYCLGREFFGKATGIGAVVLCLGIEGVLFSFGLSLVDFGFAFFAGVALLCFSIIIKDEDNDWTKTQWRLIGLMAVSSGFAAVCKVNGPSIAVVLAVALAVFVGRRDGWKRGTQVFAAVGILSFLVAAPMYFKNYLLYYNPLYPFSTFFPNRDLTTTFVQAWMTAANWNTGLEARQLWLWPVYWVKKGFVDPLSPGPAFVVGAILLMTEKDNYRYWPLYLVVAMLLVLWWMISPLTRFAWPWLSILIVFACAPLSKGFSQRHKKLLPVLLVVIAVPTIAHEMLPSVNAWNNILGRENHQHYLERVFPIHAGKTVSPPVQGIFALNRLYSEQPFTDRVLLDTNLVAYADFRTIPGPYYLMVETLGDQRLFRLAAGPVTLSLAGKGTDEEALRELERLNVKYILVKKETPSIKDVKPQDYLKLKMPDRKPQSLLVGLERWVQQGLAVKREYQDSLLYIIERK